jgi:hypothetical protein
VAIAMSPAAVVVFALVVAAAAAAAVLRRRGPGRRLAVRRSLLLAGGLALALLLLLPWSGRLLTGAALRDLGRPLAAPELLDLLQLRPGGSGLPTPLVGPLYPALALAALLFVPAGRRRQAFWLLAGFLAAAAVAAWQTKRISPVVTDWPATMLVPGAVAWAAAAGLALASLGQGLLRFNLRFSVRRLIAGAVVLLGAGTALLVVGDLASGDWSPLEAVHSPALPATVTRGHARVLWLAGRPDHGVDYAVTGPRGRSLLDRGRPPADAGRALGAVVTDVVEARTHRAGSMLRLFGIGYVVVRPGPEADRLADLVARQQDLDAKPTEQAALFQGPDVTATGWVIDGDAPPSEVKAMLTASPPRAIPDSASGRVDTTAPGTLVLTVPAADAFRASVGSTRLEPTIAFGWAQAFRLPASVAGDVEVWQGGQERRFVLLVIEGLLVLAALATMARPTRVAPPVAPSALEDTGTDLRLASLARGGVAR